MGGGCRSLLDERSQSPPVPGAVDGRVLGVLLSPRRVRLDPGRRARRQHRLDQEGRDEQARTRPTGKVVDAWQRPVGQANVVGYELLKASETEYLAKSLAKAFELPEPLKIKGVNGFGGGPFYNPEDNSITLPYQFATAVIGVISENEPGRQRNRMGRSGRGRQQLHLRPRVRPRPDPQLQPAGPRAGRGRGRRHRHRPPPQGRRRRHLRRRGGRILGRLLRSPEPPKLAEYADNHSFDRQRAYNILCWVGGSDEAILQALAENEIVPEERLVSCPAEWALLRESAEQVLEPHLKNGANLAPGAS